MSSIETARFNARMVRTALTRETWESINEAWMALKRMLAEPIDERDLPKVLDEIKRATALIRGSIYGTQLRNEIFDFRADRHLCRARRQHRAHPRRQILRAAAVGLLGRVDARQLPVGIDPALGRGAPLLPLGLRRRVPADQHRRLSDPQRAHAALADLLLPLPCRASAFPRGGLRPATALPPDGRGHAGQAARRLDQADIRRRPARIPRPTSSATTTVSATRSPKTTASTEREARCG